MRTALAMSFMDAVEVPAAAAPEAYGPRGSVPLFRRVTAPLWSAPLLALGALAASHPAVAAASSGALVASTVASKVVVRRARRRDVFDLGHLRAQDATLVAELRTELLRGRRAAQRSEGLVPLPSVLSSDEQVWEVATLLHDADRLRVAGTLADGSVTEEATTLVGRTRRYSLAALATARADADVLADLAREIEVRAKDVNREAAALAATLDAVEIRRSLEAGPGTAVGVPAALIVEALRDQPRITAD